MLKQKKRQLDTEAPTSDAPEAISLATGKSALEAFDESQKDVNQNIVDALLEALSVEKDFPVCPHCGKRHPY